MKQYDGKASVILGLCTPSSPSLPGPLRPGVVVPDRVLSMGQIEQFDILTVCKQMTCLIELLEIELFDHWTVRIYKMCYESYT